MGKEGIGLILINSAGTSNGAGNAPESAVDLELDEALDALEIIRWVKEKGLTKIQSEGDGQRVVNAINGKQSAINWINSNIIQECYFFLIILITENVQHVGRDANTVDDSLEKHALSIAIVEEWELFNPAWLECNYNCRPIMDVLLFLH